MKSLKKSPSRQTGVSLIEVLVAMLIMSFGLLGIVALHARATQFSVNAEDRNLATSLAAEMATTMYAARSNASPASFGAWNAKVNATLPAGAGSITPVAATATVPAHVIVRVQWQPNNSTNLSSFETALTAANTAAPPVQPPQRLPPFPP